MEKRRNSRRKSKKIQARKKLWKKNRSSTLLSKYSQSEAEKTSNIWDATWRTHATCNARVTPATACNKMARNRGATGVNATWCLPRSREVDSTPP